jgi:hypothetical protein
LVNVCTSTALTAFCFQHSQIKLTFHHLLLIWCGWVTDGYLYGTDLKIQSWSHCLHFVCTCEYFRNPSCAKLVTA